MDGSQKYDVKISYLEGCSEIVATLITNYLELFYSIRSVLKQYDVD